MIAIIDLDFIIPTLVTVTAPVLILLGLLTKNWKAALKTTISLSLVFLSVMTILGLIVDIGFVMFFSQTQLLYNIFIGVMAGISFVILRLIEKRGFNLKDPTLWWIIAVVVATKFIVMNLIPALPTMSLI